MYMELEVQCTCMYDLNNADFIFQELIVYCRLQYSRIGICPTCFVYGLSNTIFCPIGSAFMKHPVASQILTHNSKRLAYTLTT